MSDSLQQTAPDHTVAGLGALRRKWAIYTPSELRRHRAELDGGCSLIEGLIPAKSISIVAGDSGIGKSPLLYQAAVCVAGGLPFLGRRIQQGSVLYLDFENGLGDVDDLVGRLSRHLGLQEPPEGLLTWYYNSAPPMWSSFQLAEMIRDFRPSWVIIDSLSGFAPECEEKASNVTHVFQSLRKITSELGTTFSFTHHLKKPSVKPQEAPPPLEENPREWFQQVRGSGNLINGSDIRIGVALPRASHEVALVIGGFGRVRGKIATTYVSRVLDEDDEPLGYNVMTGAGLLFNLEQEVAYDKFPVVLRFKDAQRIYGKRAQATSDFLKKCMAVGIMRKDGKEYRKVAVGGVTGVNDG